MAREPRTGASVRPEAKTRGQDAQAHREVEALRRSEALQSEQNERLRKEKLRDVFALAVRCMVVLVFGLIALAPVALTWHYIGHQKLTWIPDEKLETVSAVLFSGTLFVFLGLYVRDRV